MGATETGLSTLLTLSSANKLNTWMFETIRPYVGGRILEIGSGLGNISSIFIQHKIPLHLSDYDPEYFRRLKASFGKESLVQDIYNIDLANTSFDASYAEILGKFDTVFALNVVEHIEDDRLAVENCYKLLAPGGMLVLLVPAYQALYSSLDKELDHYRRYSRTSLRSLLSGRFTVLKTFHFNVAGIFGWWVAGCLLHRKRLSGGQIRVYESLVPLFRLADRISFNKLGLSVIGVGRKDGAIGQW